MGFKQEINIPEDTLTILRRLKERFGGDTTLTDLCTFVEIEVCAERFGYYVILAGREAIICNKKQGALGKIGLDVPIAEAIDFITHLDEND
jgi:hypothetical protein